MRFKPLEHVNQFVATVIGLFVVLASLLVVFEVGMRYGLRSPTYWSAELVTYLCGAIYVLAGSYTESIDGHVRMDVLYRRFPPRAKAAADLIGALFLLAFCTALVWGSAEWTWAAITNGLTSGTIWDPPIAPIRGSILLGALLLLLFGVVKLVSSVRTIVAAKGPLLSG